MSPRRSTRRQSTLHYDAAKASTVSFLEGLVKTLMADLRDSRQLRLNQERTMARQQVLLQEATKKLTNAENRIRAVRRASRSPHGGCRHDSGVPSLAPGPHVTSLSVHLFCPCPCLTLVEDGRV